MVLRYKQPMEKKQPEFMVAECPAKSPDELKPGEYHWPPLQQAPAIEKALKKNPSTRLIGPAVDGNKNVVGYWYHAPSFAAAKRGIERALGDDHGKYVFEMSSSKAWRQQLVQERAEDRQRQR